MQSKNLVNMKIVFNYLNLAFHIEVKTKNLSIKLIWTSFFNLSKMVLWVHEFKPSEKNVMVNIDDIRNLDQSPRLVFIDEKCGNLIVVNDSGELTRNISQKKKSDVLQ